MSDSLLVKQSIIDLHVRFNPTAFLMRPFYTGTPAHYLGKVMIYSNLVGVVLNCLGKTAWGFEFIRVQQHPGVGRIPTPKVRRFFHFHPRKNSLLVGSNYTFCSQGFA